MKKLLFLSSLLLLTACNEANIKARVDEEDVTPNIPEGYEIITDEQLYDALHP